LKIYTKTCHLAEILPIKALNHNLLPNVSAYWSGFGDDEVGVSALRKLDDYLAPLIFLFLKAGEGSDEQTVTTGNAFRDIAGEDSQPAPSIIAHREFPSS